MDAEDVMLWDVKWIRLVRAHCYVYALPNAKWTVDSIQGKKFLDQHLSRLATLFSVELCDDLGII
jgi:hypothetical protein